MFAKAGKTQTSNAAESEAGLVSARQSIKSSPRASIKEVQTSIPGRSSFGSKPSLKSAQSHAEYYKQSLGHTKIESQLETGVSSTSSLQKPRQSLQKPTTTTLKKGQRSLLKPGSKQRASEVLQFAQTSAQNVFDQLDSIQKELQVQRTRKVDKTVTTTSKLKKPVEKSRLFKSENAVSESMLSDNSPEKPRQISSQFQMQPIQQDKRISERQEDLIPEPFVPLPTETPDIPRISRPFDNIKEDPQESQQALSDFEKSLSSNHEDLLKSDGSKEDLLGPLPADLQTDFVKPISQDADKPAQGVSASPSPSPEVQRKQEVPSKPDKKVIPASHPASVTKAPALSKMQQMRLKKQQQQQQKAEVDQNALEQKLSNLQQSLQMLPTKVVRKPSEQVQKKPSIITPLNLAGVKQSQQFAATERTKPIEVKQVDQNEYSRIQKSFQNNKSLQSQRNHSGVYSKQATSESARSQMSSSRLSSARLSKEQLGAKPQQLKHKFVRPQAKANSLYIDDDLTSGKVTPQKPSPSLKAPTKLLSPVQKSEQQNKSSFQTYKKDQPKNSSSATVARKQSKYNYLGKIEKKSTSMVNKSVDKPTQVAHKQKTMLFQKPAFKPQKATVNHFEKKTEVAKIKEIALYRDKQPIIGLRKKPFYKKQRSTEVPAEELKPVYPGEQPDDPVDLEDCPKCRRQFCPEAFGQHIQLCDRVFLKRLKEFDSQSKRVVSEQQLEYIQKLNQGFKQRVPLNQTWMDVRAHFKKTIKQQQLAFTKVDMDKKYRFVEKAETKPEVEEPPTLEQAMATLPQTSTVEQDPFALSGGFPANSFAQGIDHATPFVKSQSAFQPSVSTQFSEVQQVSSFPEQSQVYGVSPFPPVQQQLPQMSNTMTQQDLKRALKADDNALIEQGVVNNEADNRIPCEICKRKFAPQVHLKHVPICTRNYEKKHGPLSRR